MKITALVSDADVLSRQRTARPIPVTTARLFARQRPVASGDCLLILLEILGIHVWLALVVGEEGFQPEIEAADLTRAGFFRLKDGFDDTEAYPQSPKKSGFRLSAGSLQSFLPVPRA